MSVPDNIPPPEVETEDDSFEYDPELAKRAAKLVAENNDDALFEFMAEATNDYKGPAERLRLLMEALDGMSPGTYNPHGAYGETLFDACTVSHENGVREVLEALGIPKSRLPDGWNDEIGKEEWKQNVLPALRELMAAAAIQPLQPLPPMDYIPGLAFVE